MSHRWPARRTPHVSVVALAGCSFAGRSVGASAPRDLRLGEHFRRDFRRDRSRRCPYPLHTHAASLLSQSAHSRKRMRRSRMVGERANLDGRQPPSYLRQPAPRRLSRQRMPSNPTTSGEVLSQAVATVLNILSRIAFRRIRGESVSTRSCKDYRVALQPVSDASECSYPCSELLCRRKDTGRKRCFTQS